MRGGELELVLNAAIGESDGHRPRRHQFLSAYRRIIYCKTPGSVSVNVSFYRSFATKFEVQRSAE